MEHLGIYKSFLFSFQAYHSTYTLVIWIACSTLLGTKSPALSNHGWKKKSLLVSHRCNKHFKSLKPTHPPAPVCVRLPKLKGGFFIFHLFVMRISQLSLPWFQLPKKPTPPGCDTLTRISTKGGRVGGVEHLKSPGDLFYLFSQWITYLVGLNFYFMVLLAE